MRELAGVGQHDIPYGVVGNAVGDAVYMIRCARLYFIFYLDAFLVLDRVYGNDCIGVTFVVECLLYLAARFLGQLAVVDDRWCTNAAQPAVPAVVLIVGEVVEKEREPYESEGLVVGFLSDIRFQFAVFQLAVVGRERHAVEQVFAFAHMLGSPAGKQQRDNDREEQQQTKFHKRVFELKNIGR